jgi:5-methylcytosine-specific restriction endonuclease McrA
MHKITDQDLLRTILKIRNEEKKLTLQLLELLVIVDQRSLFSDLGCESLFGYCVKILGYSKAEAALRVNSSRLMKKYPKVRDALKTNQLSISSASKIQSFFAIENPEAKIKNQVLNKSIGKSKREVECIIAEVSLRKKQSMKIVLCEKLLRKLKRVQNEFGDCSELMAIEALVDQKVRELDTLVPQRPANYKESKNQRYISRRAREAVFKTADNRCEGISKISNKRCSARINLQIDHIKPIHIGGKSSQENLRVLCFNCNQRSFKRQQIYSETTKKLVPF